MTDKEVIERFNKAFHDTVTLAEVVEQGERDRLNCLNCGHPESDHETVEYRGDKSRSCVRHLNQPGQPRCHCRRYRSQPTREEVLESALRSLRNECAGLLGAFGDEIAPIVGHTNLTVLQYWIANADSVLPPPK